MYSDPRVSHRGRCGRSSLLRSRVSREKSNHDDMHYRHRISADPRNLHVFQVLAESDQLWRHQVDQAQLPSSPPLAPQQQLQSPVVPQQHVEVPPVNHAPVPDFSLAGGRARGESSADEELEMAIAGGRLSIVLTVIHAVLLSECCVCLLDQYACHVVLLLSGVCSVIGLMSMLVRLLI